MQAPHNAPLTVRIKEQSWCARIAARKLGTASVAVVLGNTIHLWNARRDEFLKSPAWVAHELEHVRQFQHYGFLRFCALYLWESVRKGYYNNRFEEDARRAENGRIRIEGVAFI